MKVNINSIYWLQLVVGVFAGLSVLAVPNRIISPAPISNSQNSTTHNSATQSEVEIAGIVISVLAGIGLGYKIFSGRTVGFIEYLRSTVGPVLDGLKNYFGMDEATAELVVSQAEELGPSLAECDPESIDELINNFENAKGPSDISVALDKFRAANPQISDQKFFNEAASNVQAMVRQQAVYPESNQGIEINSGTGASIFDGKKPLFKEQASIPDEFLEGDSFDDEELEQELAEIMRANTASVQRPIGYDNDSEERAYQSEDYEDADALDLSSFV